MLEDRMNPEINLSECCSETLQLRIQPFTRLNSEEPDKPSGDLLSKIEDGNLFPMKVENFPKHLVGKPIQEVCTGIQEKVGTRNNIEFITNYTITIFQTFCVVSSRFNKLYLHRFSASNSLLILPPWSNVR